MAEHYADPREWTRLRAGWSVWAWIHSATVSTMYILINTNVWAKWQIPYTSLLFLTSVMLSALDHITLRVSWDMYYGRYIAHTFLMAAYRALLPFTAIAHSFAFARQLSDDDHASPQRTSDGQGQLALVSISAISVFVRLWLLATADAHEYGPNDTKAPYRNRRDQNLAHFRG